MKESNFPLSNFVLDHLGEAEREILTLAPHFEAKPLPESFDSKLDRLNIAATHDITWLHLLSNLIIHRTFIFDSSSIFQTTKMRLLNVLIIVNYFPLIVMQWVDPIFSFFVYFHG